jgi:hypothetical protein
MNTKYLLLTVATVALVSACSDDEFQGTSTKVVGNDHIVASLGNDTRTQLSTDDNAAVLWSKNDALSVFTSTSTTDNSNTTTTLAQNATAYTLSGNGGESTGTFSGVLSDGATKVAALFPYDKDATIAASGSNYKISTTLKSEISFKADSTNFLNGAPMVAVFTAGSNDVTFQNPGAIVDITVKNVTTDYDYIVLKSVGTSAPNLNGAVEITTGDAPAMTLATGNSGSTSTKISWTASATQDIRAIFPVPTGTYNLEAYLGKSGSDNTTSEKLVLALGSKTIEANTRYGRTVMLDQVTGSFAKAAKNAAEATSVLADEKDGLVSAVVVEAIAASDASKTITLPANQTTATATPVSLTLNSVEATEIAVNGTTADGTSVAGEVTIAAAGAVSGSAAAEIEKLTLTLGSSVVTLTTVGEGKTVKYKEVVLDADNSVLKLGTGVTVDKVTVNTGSEVSIAEGATLSGAALATDATKATIYYAATDPNISVENISVYPQAVYDLKHLTTGTYELTSDITVKDPIVLTNSITLDLKGKKITKSEGTDAALVIDGENVVVKITDSETTKGSITVSGCNAAVSATNKGAVEIGAVALTGGVHSVLADNEGKVTLNKTTISGTSSQPIYAENKGKIVITDGTYSNPTTDGIEVVLVTGVSNFTMNGGTINSTSSSGPAVRVSNGSTGIIEGTISAAQYALYVFENDKNYEGTNVTIQGSAELSSSAKHCVNVIPLSTNKADYGKDRNKDRQPVVLTVTGNASIETTAGTTTLSSGEVDGYYAVTGNGTAHNTTINIQGGTIKSSYVGLYHPQIGTLNISGGTIEGVYGGVEIRAGELNLTGGEIKATKTDEEAKSYTNSNGNTTTGAALAIAHYAYGDTDANSQALANPTLAVNIPASSTAKLTGPAALFESNPNATTDAASKVTISVAGGTFNGKISSVDVKDFIMGGKFSDMASAVPYATGTASAAASITLSANQTVTSLSSLFSDRKNLIVDLGTNKITVNATGTDQLAPKAIDGNATSTTNYGSLEFKNGTIEYTGDHSNNWALFINEGQLTLDGITFNATGWSTAIGAQKEFVKLVAKNSEISGLYFSIASNASGGGAVYGKDAKMEFENTKFISKETGFMNNVEATISFKDCTFQGNHQGALLRGGAYTFSGTNSIILYPSNPTTHSECMNNAAWASGNKAAFAPLVIGNRENSSYQYATTITFASGSTTTVKMASVTGTDEISYASSYPGVYVAANSGTGIGVTITGLSNLYKDSSVIPSDSKDIVYYIPDGGSSNITVDGTAVTSSTSTTLSTKTTSN